MYRRTGWRWLSVLLGAGLTAAALAAEDGFPDRPLRFIVPYAAGGTGDVSARLVAQKLATRVGKPVIVENRPGAGGTVGLGQLANTPADGYTMSLIASGFEWLPEMYPKLAFNPASAFTPLAFLGSSPYVLMTHAGTPFKTVAEFIGHAKANKGKISYATAGIGTLHHLLGMLLQRETGIEMTSIPYGGAAPAEASLLGGQVDVMFDPLSMAAAQVRAGKLRPIASTGGARARVLPDVPTLTEAGVPIRASFWLGIALRSGAPAPIVERLNQEINASILDPEVKAKFEALELEIEVGSPAKFAAFLASQAGTWGRVVRESGIKTD